MQHALTAYYNTLKEYDHIGVKHETAVRSAMQNLLSEAGKQVSWNLIPEYSLSSGRTGRMVRPDGTFLDSFGLQRGWWEAKDTKDDLETEIKKKFAAGYPQENILFEDTRRAVLFQGRNSRYEFDLTNPNELRGLLDTFTSYSAPEYEKFHEAVREFQTRIPELAKGLMERITEERSANRAFTTAFGEFHELCRTSLNPQIALGTIEEMLVQHLLTERLFRTIFDNADFTRRNVIAAEIEKVIDALTQRSFNRAEFTRSLDRFYVPIENAARTITEWNEKQAFLNTLYERFFQGFSVKQADTHGIVYTPQEIVNFMLASVEYLLKTEFGSSLSTPGVKILDPATGTGNFIVNLLKHHITRRDMKQKYTEDLFANEIMLLPYYIASLNIEHEYYAQSGEYLPFEGMCFADTLAIAEGKQGVLGFSEENTERTQRQQSAPITVIIGNPPYNVGQQNENDNNNNRRYAIVDKRVAETYSKASIATNKNALSDAYVKFFRWATDRLKGTDGKERDGIVCYVSNNGFLNGIAFDGFRKQLLEEFTTIYHLDLGGNARSSGGGNVFGIMVGVGITIMVRKREKQAQTADRVAQVFHYAIDNRLNASEKLKQITTWKSTQSLPFRELTPDTKHNWLTEGLHTEFDSFLPLGNKKEQIHFVIPIFGTFSNGLKTNRDAVVYDFQKTTLENRIQKFIADYNSEVDRWVRSGSGKKTDIDDFVSYENVAWSRDLKLDLQRARYAQFETSHIRNAHYRPFCTKYLFFDRILNEEVYVLPSIFPTPASEQENRVICLAGPGNRMPFGCLVTNVIPSLDFAFEKAQCFPFYVYAEDGSNRQENITDWALEQFQEAHGASVTKWDIFHYAYALLHDPAYRTRYAENLKRELPRIPLSPTTHTFAHFAEIGQQLMRLHLDYETAKEYPLQWIENREVSFSWRVEKMRLSKDKTQISVNESLMLQGVPQEAFEYRLGNRSALEWVLDQYQQTTDKRSGIVSDPNRPEDLEYIVRLIGKVITVSLNTVSLVQKLG